MQIEEINDMKKKLVLAMIILGASLTLTACTSQNLSANDSSEFQQNTDSTLNNPETTYSVSNFETTNNNSNAEGGNSDITKYIEITVAEDKYFYENHEILYDELIKVFDEADENTVVKISDENATLKAFKDLTKALEKRGIMFEAAN